MEIRPPDIGAEPMRPEPWRKSALGFFAATLVLNALFGFVAQYRHPMLGLAWTEAFVFLLPAVAAAAGSNLSPSAFLLLSRRPRPREVATGAGVGAAVFLAGSGVMTLTTLVVPHSWVEAYDVTRLFAGSGAERVGMGVVATALAPLAEEVAFRGYALSSLRTWARPWPSILGSTLLFAAMHLDPVRLPAMLVLGATFGWLAYRSGSIWPAVAAHAVNNGLGSALAVAGGGEGPAEAELTGALALVAVGLLALVPLAALYWRATPRPPPPEDALVRRDPRDPSVRFRPGRVPRSILWLGVFGLVLFLALAMTGGGAAGARPG